MKLTAQYFMDHFGEPLPADVVEHILENQEIVERLRNEYKITPIYQQDIFFCQKIESILNPYDEPQGPPPAGYGHDKEWEGDPKLRSKSQ